MARRERSERNIEQRKHIGFQIKSLRTEKGLTQAQLAEKVDVTEKHLSQIEQGVSFPSIIVLMDIAKALGQPVEVLLYGTREAHTEAWQYIDSAYSALSEDGRATLHRIASELVEFERKIRSASTHKD